MKSRIVTPVLFFGALLLAFTGIFLPGAAVAADAGASANNANATALRSLNKVSILMDKAAMAYQMFNLDQGNPIYRQTIDKSVNRIQQAKNDYQQPARDAGQADILSTINSNVSAFLTHLASDESKIARGTSGSSAAAAQMKKETQAAQGAIQKLYQAIEQEDNVKVEKAVQKSRDLASLLQALSTAYVFQGAGSSNTSNDNTSAPSIDEMANKFSDQLGTFNIHTDKVIGLNTKVREVKNKWVFIKSSLINYKQDRVPFLVYRYADIMVDDLLTIGQMWETRNEAPIKAPSFGGSQAGAPLPGGGK